MRHNYTASGVTIVEIRRDSEGWFVPVENGSPKRLPASVSAEVDSLCGGDGWEELAVHIKATGYFDPHEPGGIPENREWPKAESCELCGGASDEGKPLSKESVALLDDLLTDEILEAELELDEPDSWPEGDW